MRRALILAAALLAGCSDPTTGLLFVVNSDVTLQPDTQLFVVVDDLVGAGSSTTTVEAPLMPLSFLVEASGDSLGPLRIHLDLGPGRGRRSVRVGFVKDEVRALPVFIESACRNVRCVSGATCIAGVCGDDFVDVSTLPKIDKPGDELTFVPSAPDSGVVADAGDNDADVADDGPDAEPRDTGSPDDGVEDAGVDAGFPDAGNMSCDPFAVDNGCNPPDVCREVNGMGFCVPPMGGGEPLGSPCTATFNGGGLYQGDDCNPDDNAYCRGALPGTPTGTCVARCRAGETGFCATRLSTSECVDEGSRSLCLLPAPASNDHGDRCLSPTNCDTRLCLQSPYWVCSLDCSGAQDCPQDFVCRFDIGAQCFIPCQDHPDCDMTNNTYCSPEGVCVGECSGSRPCLDGQTCIDDRCV